MTTYIGVFALLGIFAQSYQCARGNITEHERDVVAGILLAVIAICVK